MLSMIARPLCLLILPLFLSAPTLAQPLKDIEISDSQLTSYRYHYRLAKDALKKNRLKTFQKHYSELGNYPLRQYLDYTKLRSQLGKHPTT